MPQPEYKPVRAPFCEWKMFSPENWPGRWRSGCGSEYELGNSRPGDPQWTYCPSCGRTIAVEELPW